MRPKEGDRVRDRATGVGYRVTLVGDRMIGLEAEGLPDRTVITLAELKQSYRRAEDGDQTASSPAPCPN